MRTLIQILLISFSTLILFSGCSKNLTATKTLKIDPTLPVVVINGSISDMNAIAFEWKALQNERVGGVYVYRSQPDGEDKKLHRIDAVESRFTTHYVDTKVKPGTAYQYRFSTFDKAGNESKAGKTINVSTLPLFESVSFFDSIDAMPRSAKLIWRPHTNINVNQYYLQRKTHKEDSKFKTIAKIKGRLNAEYIDMDLRDNEIYSYRLYAVTFDDIVSKPGKPVQVSTKPLPQQVKHLTATPDQPKQVSLTWNASPEKDIAYYKVYRSSRSGGGFDYHVKLHETHFIDKISEDETSYFYKVTAVDTDELESPMGNPVKGSTLKRPIAPVVTLALIKDKSVRLHWKRSDDRTVSYIIVKTTQLSWLDKKRAEIKVSGDTLQYTDVNVVPERPYIYELIAVDKNNIRSLPSDAQKLLLEAEKP